MKATISDSFTTTKQIHVMSVNQRLKLTKNIRYTHARENLFISFPLNCMVAVWKIPEKKRGDELSDAIEVVIRRP
jgi:hypothetical protein